MADPVMPAGIVQWMAARMWGIHHVLWHAERQWDISGVSTHDWIIRNGGLRADRQEGAPGNGFEFLIMHRAMLELLRSTFAQQVDLFVGWQTPPTDRTDPGDPVPSGDPFDRNMLNAIRQLQDAIDIFQTDDEFGLYVETQLRPTSQDPRSSSDDMTTGIHNYIHVRFADPNSSVDMGNPLVNIENQRFWRLHGWIDARWSVFRAIMGLSDEESSYVAALNAEKKHMDTMQMAGMAQSLAADIPTQALQPFHNALRIAGRL